MKIQIEKGSSRIVSLISFLPIAIKFARVNIIMAFKEIKRIGFKKFIRKIGKYNMYRACVIGGIDANINERNLWRETKSQHLMPTYACLFWGLINIQKKGLVPGIRPCLDMDDFRRRGDSHIVYEDGNFFDGKIVDYGSEDCREYFLHILKAC